MPTDERALRVLVVDDELLIRWAIAETLVAAGYPVVEADNGASALRQLADGPDDVDAIVLDYRLPDSNDLTLLARVRQLTPDRPVIMMSAHSTPDMIRGAHALGVHEVLAKPFEMSALLSALQAASRLADS